VQDAGKLPEISPLRAELRVIRRDRDLSFVEPEFEGLQRSGVSEA
jgi:hypothetical protein